VAPTVQHPTDNPDFAALLAEIRAGLGDEHQQLEVSLRFAEHCFWRGRQAERNALAAQQT
jgi:hypothetical protein